MVLSRRILWVVCLQLVCCLWGVVRSQTGAEYYQRGLELFHRQQLDDAASELWKAVLLHNNNDPSYDVQTVFQQFMQCYIQQGRTADGLAFVALESFRRGQIDMGKNYLQQALSVDPNNPLALQVQEEFGENTKKNKASPNADLKGKTPEQLYAIASQHFADKHYEECADIFEISCIRSNYKLGPSCANAVYCRTMILDYGYNGTQFEMDMQRIEDLIRLETNQNRVGNATHFAWNRATSTHPHMMLGYPISSELKRFVAESVAFLDERMARAQQVQDGSVQIPDLPPGLPYSLEAYRDSFTKNTNQRIRVGFVGSGFNSKAVLYLSQDMFRFFSNFEIHIFSFGPPDNPGFIQVGMRGVDWRERVKSNVHQFHDLQAMKVDHVIAAQYIHDQRIQILIEWDGYARQGERAQGLFALRPAPVQILHQEYLGTSGALYVDYLITDKVSTPPELDHLYTEKLIFMPNHFFSKGHAYQSEVKKPTYHYLAKETPYKLGTGSPQENRCLDPDTSKNVSFVYCNFNKFLKNNPETIRSWIRILREVPDSMLCLLENPDVGIPYFAKYVHETAGTSNNNDPTTFAPGDGDNLVQRIRFLPWENNPFDHQMRNQDMCNVMLDSFPYNGHTIAQDALYGGVPIVTRSDGKDMSSRVTTSANIVLGMDYLNAYDGPRQYEDIAIRIGTDRGLYNNTRTKLVDSCLQRNPMHPYWDVARYVKNFEAGLTIAWQTFIDGRPPAHIYIEESELAQKGTYDDEILANPPEGKRKRIVTEEL